MVSGEGPQQAEGAEGYFVVAERSQEVLCQICLAEWLGSPVYSTSIMVSDVCPLGLDHHLHQILPTPLGMDGISFPADQHAGLA